MPTARSGSPSSLVATERGPRPSTRRTGPRAATASASSSPTTSSTDPDRGVTHDGAHEGLDKSSCQEQARTMQEVRVLHESAAVEVALDPTRAAILEALTEPASAATLATLVGSTRQKVNYHLKALEAHGLVELA